LDIQSRERLLPVSTVLERTSLSRSYVYDAVKRGEFPPPIKISVNRVAWPESAVSAWIASKIAAA